MAWTKAQQDEAITDLRKLLQPGDKVYTTVKHVSRSGMQRVIDVHLIRDNRPVWIAYRVAQATDRRFNERYEAVVVGGCGMDMGFELVYTLSRILFPDGFKVEGRGRNGDMSGWDTNGGYALRQEWL